MWSMFHFGFAADERIAARLAEHRRGDTAPRDALGKALGMSDRFERAAFGAWLSALARDGNHEIVPGGRRLRNRPASMVDCARRLGAALVPLGPEYPLPFFPLTAP
jgi:hypothetical protein